MVSAQLYNTVENLPCKAKMLLQCDLLSFVFKAFKSVFIKKFALL